jgi:hypothetical protein
VALDRCDGAVNVGDCLTLRGLAYEMDGVVRKPSALAMTVGSPPSRTETALLVVPRSMPTARAIIGFSSWAWLARLFIAFSLELERY